MNREELEAVIWRGLRIRDLARAGRPRAPGTGGLREMDTAFVAAVLEAADRYAAPPPAAERGGGSVHFRVRCSAGHDQGGTCDVTARACSPVCWKTPLRIRTTLAVTEVTCRRCQRSAAGQEAMKALVSEVMTA